MKVRLFSHLLAISLLIIAGAGALAQTPEALKHYQAGSELVKQQRLPDAIRELQQALHLQPDYNDAQFLLGLLLQQTGKPDEAIGQFRALLKRSPKSAEAHNWLGVAYLQKNALKDAMAAFREAIALKPDYVRAHNNLGSTLAQSGDFEAGIQSLRAGLRYDPNDLQIRLNLGMALRNRGDADAALEQFAAVLKQHPEDPEVQYQYGQTLRQKGDLDGAVQAFETALNLNPELREAYYGLGQTLKQVASANRPRRPGRLPSAESTDLYKRGAEAAARADWKAARELLQRSVDSDASNAEAHNLLGFIIGRGGDLRTALEHLDRAVTLRPDYADAHYNLGVASWFSGNKPKAVSELDEALRWNPASGEAYSFRGMTYRESGDLPHARQALQRAVALNPNLPSPYIDLGIVLLAQAKPVEAMGQFEAALNLRSAGPLPDLELVIRGLRQALPRIPSQAEAQNLLGRLLGAASADAQQVIAAFQDAVRLKPGYAEAHNNLGLVYIQIGDDEKAIASFREAIRHAPEYADARANLGALLVTSDPDEAIRELEKAIALQPALIKAQYSLGLAYGNSPTHGPDKEIAQLRKVIAAEPSFPRAHFGLGRALLRKGNVPEAVSELKLAVDADPMFGEARYQYGLALTRSGKQQEGQIEIQKSRELIAADQKRQFASLDLAEGKTALEKGETDLAIQKFQAVVKLRPEAPEAHHQLGLALAQKGDRQAAMAAFRQALSLDPGHTGARQRLDGLAAASGPDDAASVALFEGYIRDRKFKEVEPLLRQYVEERPSSSWGWYALGYTYFGQQKLGESIQALARSLQLNVNNAEAHKVMGRNMMLIGRFDAANVEFQAAARLAPKSADIPYNLGKLFSIQDNYAEARRWFEKAISLDPGYMEAYDGLGFCFEATGEDAPAVANYRRSIELNESRKAGFETPYVNMSVFLLRTGDAQKAFELAERAIEVNPNSDRAWFQLGKTRERRDELPAAVEAVNRAISINARSSAYHYVLATLYRRLGKVEDSRKAMEVFSRLDQESNELEKRRRQGQRPQSGVPVKPNGYARE